MDERLKRVASAVLVWLVEVSFNEELVKTFVGLLEGTSDDALGEIITELPRKLLGMPEEVISILDESKLETSDDLVVEIVDEVGRLFDEIEDPWTEEVAEGSSEVAPVFQLTFM